MVCSTPPARASNPDESALPKDEAASVLAALEDLESKGLRGSLIDVRHIDGKLWEIKVSAQRVFYVIITGPTMILLHAYKKQGQKAPPKEIDVARKRMKLVFGGEND